MSPLQQIYKDGIIMTDRTTTRLVQCKAILRTISFDSIFDDCAHFDIHQSIGAVLDLLDMANEDVESLDYELGRLGKYLHNRDKAASLQEEEAS